MSDVLLLGPHDAVAPRQRSDLLRRAITAAGWRTIELTTSNRASIDETLASVQSRTLEHDPVLAVVMLGPFVQGLGAGAVLRRVFGVPVVFDLRDPWHVPGGWRGLRSRTGARALQRAALYGAPAIATGSGLRQMGADAGGDVVTVLTGCDDADVSSRLLAEVWSSAQLYRDQGNRVVFYGGKVGGPQYPIEQTLTDIARAERCTLVLATPSEVPPPLRNHAVMLGTVEQDVVRCWHRCADVSFIGEGRTPNTEHSVPVKVFDLLADAERAVGWLPRTSEGDRLLDAHDGFARCDDDTESLLAEIDAVPVKSAPSSQRAVPDWLSRRTSVRRVASLLLAVAAT
jgi:hypothetical protein